MILTIDRIEAGFAVCEMEDGKFLDLPKGFLPEGASEGSKIRIELDFDSEEKDKKRIREKMNKLFKE